MAKKFISLSIVLTLILGLFNCFNVQAAETFSPLWPLKQSTLIGALDIYAGNKGVHGGIDVRHNGYPNQDVYAVADGKVIKTYTKCSCSSVSDCGNTYGNYVFVEHTVNGVKYQSRYGHLLYGSITVSVGDTVKAGQKLGCMGNSGNSYGEHLHFEIYKGTSRVKSVSGKTLDYYLNNESILSTLKFKQGLDTSPVYGKYIKENFKLKDGYYVTSHTCPTAPKNSKGEWNYQTSGSKLGACKGCGKEFNWNSTKMTNEAGLYIAKSKNNIKLYNKPYEDATCKFNGISGELVIEGYVTNAYGSKWYITSGDDIGTVYIYEKDLKDIYTKNGDYYESNYHKYEGGNFIEDTSSNQSSNNTSNNTQTNNENVVYSDNQTEIITTPQQPTYIAPTLTLSTYSMDINHILETSRNVIVKVSGSLPENATLSAEPTVGTTIEWGTYSNGEVILIVKPNWKLGENDSTIAVKLLDGNGNIVLQKDLIVHSTSIKYTINFNANGGINTPDLFIVYPDADMYLPVNQPTREGYRFLGWSESKTASSPSFYPNERISINHSTTLYAVWEDMFEGLENYKIKLSEDSLLLDYYSNRTETILVSVEDEDDIDFTIDFECDSSLKWSLGDYWYNEYGHMCREIIIETTNRDIRDNTATVYIKDELGKIRKEKSLEIYNYEDSYSNRNTDTITVYLDGNKLDFDVNPSIINGRTMVPMRKIFEEIGAFVYWDNETQTAFGETIEDFVTISIGDNYLEHNGEFVGLDSPATIISGRTLVPARAIAESFNCDVDWIGDLQVVTIESPKSKYNEDLIVGEWDVVAEIDDYTSFYPYDSAIATYEFNDEGGVYITYHDRDDMDYFFYDVTKGGFVIIYNQPKTMYMLGTIADDEIYIQECNEYSGNELLRWGTVEGDTFIRRQFKNDKGVNYLEEDDGIVLQRK